MSDGAAPPAIGADADAAAQARARALEIANRLSSKLGVPTTGGTTPTDTSVLGKRGRDEFPVGDGRPVGSRKKKIFVPVEKFPDVNFFGLIIGPRGTTLKQMEVDTGARIFLRGKGASKEGEEESDEELHVLIMADEDSVLERASTMIEELLHNPEKMAQVKQQQLSQVQGGEFATASNVQLPSSLYSDDAVANPITFAPHEKVHGETQELRIPHEKVGLVIGRMGETIKSIQVQTGCHIQIAKENECPGPDRSVSLSGEPHQIEAARVEILRIISETGRAAALTRGPIPPTPGFSSGFSTPGLGHPGGHYGPSGGMYQQPDGSNSKTIYIPQIYVGLLIGKSGETIRNIQMKTGTMIQVSHVQKDESSDPQTAQRPVTIIGPPHAVNQCEAEINTLIANSQLSGGSAPGVTGPTSGVSQSQTIQIPNAAVGVIIGRMGETIKRIQSVTGTRVQISKDEGKPERDVTITGTQHQIDHARREIDSVIQGVELREMPPRGPSSRPPPSYPPHGGYGGAPSYGGAPGYGHYPPPGHGYGAPPGYPPHHDPYYGAPAHDPYGGYGAHAPYGGYGAAGAPPTTAAPAAAHAAAAPAETKPEAAASTDQAEYERAYYAHQAAYYAQHGAYDTAPFVWPPKQ